MSTQFCYLLHVERKNSSRSRRNTDIISYIHVSDRLHACLTVTCPSRLPSTGVGQYKVRELGFISGYKDQRSSGYPKTPNWGYYVRYKFSRSSTTTKYVTPWSAVPRVLSSSLVLLHRYTVRVKHWYKYPHTHRSWFLDRV